jgi:hypothetical protein
VTTYSEYQGQPGWSGPISVRMEGSRAVEARCLVCGEVWMLEELAVDQGARVLGPASCPRGCGTDDPAETPGPQRRAGFRPDEPTLLE